MKVIVYLVPWILLAGVVLGVYYLEVKRPPESRLPPDVDSRIRNSAETRLILLVGGVAIILARLYPSLFWTVPFVGVMLVVDIFYCRRLRRRAVFRELCAEDFRRCPQCFYDLRGSPPSGVCPECGREYSGPQLSHEWRRRLKISARGR